MREILRAVADGERSVAEAEAELRGYATTESGRFDAARERRRGICEAILADGKSEAQLIELATTALETTGRAILTRLEPNVAAALKTQLTAATIDHNVQARTLVARADGVEQLSIDATVAVVTGGTADLPVAGEAAAIARESGPTVELICDVGVANLTRVVDQLDRLRRADVLVVAAGREGALATVVAGLVDAPVIGLPVSVGYGAGGDGEAAFYGMVQSCTALSVVNIDAGYTAGAQAGLIARAIAEARSSGTESSSPNSDK